MVLILTDGDQNYQDEEKSFDSLKELDCGKRFDWDHRIVLKTLMKIHMVTDF